MLVKIVINTSMPDSTNNIRIQTDLLELCILLVELSEDLQVGQKVARVIHKGTSLFPVALPLDNNCHEYWWVG